MDQLYLMRQAIELAKHGNFARAAEAMNLTQPSVTRGIAELERSLGVQLFERSKRGVVPTAFGRVLLERSESLLRSHADLRRELQLLAGLETGSLAIGVGPYSAETTVADAVARLVNAHPRLRIECTVAVPDRVIQDVLQGHVDVGVARDTGLETVPALVVESLPPLRAYLSCRPDHPLAKVHKPTLAQILAFPLVTIKLRRVEAAPASGNAPAHVQDSAGITEFAPQIVVNSLWLARLIAQGSDAIFPGTARHIADDVAAGRLVKLDFESPVLNSPHGIFYLRDRPLAPAALEFIEKLRIVAKEAQTADAAWAVASGTAPRLARRRGRASGN